MADGYPNLGQLERTWYASRVGGVTAQTPFNQIKRNYWNQRVYDTNNRTGITELERRWLAQVITRESGSSPVDDSSESTLWREVVAALGLTPSQFINDNKKKFFLNANFWEIGVSDSVSIAESNTVS